ncbi:MAG TPA: ferredoxin reductase family protein [Steroidobacteraceae bacterium]|nr:ferredoxin reductase family protein [Steroidobacteraceae bacterium]
MAGFFNAIFWFVCYVVAILLPLRFAILIAPVEAGRSFLLELGVGCGLIAYPLLTFEFLLVGRLRGISQLYGNDVLMFFHKYMGIAALLFVIGHAALVSRGDLTQLNPLGGSAMLRDGNWALWLVVGIALTAVFRKALRLKYGLWMVLHSLLALGIAVFGLKHILAVHAYTARPMLQGLMVGCFLAYLLPLLRYRVWEFFSMQRKPWKVVANRDEGGRSRTLVLEPIGHAGFEFQPGQFAWLSTGRPFVSEQHPISLASSAEVASDRRIEFSIRDLGDWSGQTVPKVAPGAQIYVNGPFGGFSLDREPGQGFVLIAGGIGITPMRSMLLTMRDRGDVRPVILFYADRDSESLIHREELTRLTREMSLTLVLVLEAPPAGWTGEQGRIDAALLRRHLPVQFKRYQYFMCGPAAMMDAVEEHLATLRLPQVRVHAERFNIV